MDRRVFLKTGAMAAGAVAVGAAACTPDRKGKVDMREIDGKVMTVAGPVPPEALGFTLPHEHVLVDFIGAEQVSRDRYDAEEAFRVILPHLAQAKALGCEAFVECTPAYIGRDAALVRRLGEASGLRMIVNTGYYGAAGDRFVPAHAYEESAAQLADRWIAEWENGIEGTGIRPGFIKCGVDAAPLSEIDAKLVRASAKAHLQTGLTVAVHTRGGAAAREELAILAEEGVSPAAWIWVHTQHEEDSDVLTGIAESGGWLSFDGIRPSTVEQHVGLVTEMKRRGQLSRVMVSHDAGWYQPGQPNGGAFRPFDTLFTEFLPALRETGFTQGEIDTLTVVNPSKAFTVGVRKA